MTTSRFLMGLAVCVLVIMTATPVRADTMVQVNMSSLTFVGTGGSETVSISFNLDATTNSVVPGTMSLLATGVIGESFNFINPGTVVGGETFLWADVSGDEVSVNTCGFDCGTFPSLGSYNTIDVTLLCGPSNACSSNGLQGLHPSSGTFTVSAVPEPSSLLLLLGGLFGLWPVFGRRRRRSLQNCLKTNDSNCL